MTTRFAMLIIRNEGDAVTEAGAHLGYIKGSYGSTDHIFRVKTYKSLQGMQRALEKHRNRYAPTCSIVPISINYTVEVLGG